MAAVQTALEKEQAATARLHAALAEEQVRRQQAEAVADEARRGNRAAAAKARWGAAAAGAVVRGALQSLDTGGGKGAAGLEERCERLEGHVAELQAFLQVRLWRSSGAAFPNNSREMAIKIIFGYNTVTIFALLLHANAV